jgi:hypothetical protein
MLNLNLETILKHLQENKIDAKLQKETNQIYVVYKIQNQDFPLFIRIYEGTNLLQLLAFMPTNVKPSARPDLARLLHLLNKEMDIPGFGMDETAVAEGQGGVAFYRIIIPTMEAKVDELLLDTFIGSIQSISEAFFPVIATVANGMATYEDVLKKANEAPKEAPEKK